MVSSVSGQQNQVQQTKSAQQSQQTQQNQNAASNDAVFSFSDNVQSKFSFKNCMSVEENTYINTGGGGGGNDFDWSGLGSALKDLCSGVAEIIKACKPEGGGGAAGGAQLTDYKITGQSELANVNKAISDWGDTTQTSLDGIGNRTAANWDNLGTTGTAAHKAANTLSDNIKASQTEMQKAGVEIDSSINELLDSQQQIGDAASRAESEKSNIENTASQQGNAAENAVGAAEQGVTTAENDKKTGEAEHQNAEDAAVSNEQKAQDAKTQLESAISGLKNQKADALANFDSQTATTLATMDESAKAEYNQQRTEARAKLAEEFDKKIQEKEGELKEATTAATDATDAKEKAIKAHSDFKTASTENVRNAEKAADDAKSTLESVKSNIQTASEEATKNVEQLKSDQAKVDEAATKALSNKDDFESQVKAMTDKNKMAAGQVKQLNDRGNRAFELKNASTRPTDKGKDTIDTPTPQSKAEPEIPAWGSIRDNVQSMQDTDGAYQASRTANGGNITKQEASITNGLGSNGVGGIHDKAQKFVAAGGDLKTIPDDEKKLLAEAIRMSAIMSNDQSSEYGNAGFWKNGNGTSTANQKLKSTADSQLQDLMKYYDQAVGQDGAGEAILKKARSQSTFSDRYKA